MESCPLVISHILAEFHPERATYTSLPIHIVVWGNFLFKERGFTSCFLSLHVYFFVCLCVCGGGGGGG